MRDEPSILVLGVGNLLRRDEGFGVHVVRRLAERFEPSSNVTILDGGTAGMTLLDAIMDCQQIVLIDVAHMQSSPGTIRRLQAEFLSRLLRTKQSAHDWGVNEVLLHALLLGHEPSVVIIAAEPQDMDTWSDELTPLLASKLPIAVEYVVAEVEAAGGRLVPALPLASRSPGIPYATSDSTST